MSEFIYDASNIYVIDLGQMKNYEEDLEPRNVIVMDCRLKKYHKTRGSNQDKVAFKISGISFICKGILPLNKFSALGASPSKKPFVSNDTLFTYTYIDLITQFRR